MSGQDTVREGQRTEALRPGAPVRLRRVGLVVHPARDIDGPLSTVMRWAGEHGIALVQLPFGGDHPRLSMPVVDHAHECDLVVAIGGDGTTLAAIRAAADSGRPVLGVACGSLGALTTVGASELGGALERIRGGDWCERHLPALRVTAGGRELVAYNDLVVVRRGEGQIKVFVRVDGALATRLAGDGCVVCTPAGSAAYTIAAGGPLLAPDLAAFAFTALPAHGGFSPPLVVAAGSVLELEVLAGHGGGRLEIDGHTTGEVPDAVRVSFAAHVATAVVLPGRESYLTGLRRRGILADSPRIIADDARAGIRPPV